MRSQVFALVLLLVGAWLLNAPSGSRQEATVQAQNHDWRAIEESHAEAARVREAYRHSIQEQFAEVPEESPQLIEVEKPSIGNPPKPHLVLLAAQKAGEQATEAEAAEDEPAVDEPAARVGGCNCDCDEEKIAELVAEKIKEMLPRASTAVANTRPNSVKVEVNRSTGRWENHDGLSLREHLRQKHFIDTSGFTYDELVQIHDSIHDEEGPMPASSRTSTQVQWGIVTRGPNGCPIDPTTGREMCPVNRGTRPRSQNGGGWFPGKAIVKAIQRR